MIQSMNSQQFSTKHKISVGLGAAATTAMIIEQPAHATVADVATTVTSIGTVAAGAVTIVLLAMGVRLAIKQVNRISVKG